MLLLEDSVFLWVDRFCLVDFCCCFFLGATGVMFGRLCSVSFVSMILAFGGGNDFGSSTRDRFLVSKGGV